MAGLGIEPSTLHMLSNCSTTQLHLQPWSCPEFLESSEMAQLSEKKPVLGKAEGHERLGWENFGTQRNAGVRSLVIWLFPLPTATKHLPLGEEGGLLQKEDTTQAGSEDSK